MSLHANLTPEAAARVAKQHRNTTLSSIIIALFLFFFIGVSLYLIIIKDTRETRSPGHQIYYPQPSDVTEIAPPEVLTSLSKPRPPAAGGNPARNIVSISTSLTSLPIPDSLVTDNPFGMGHAGLDGIGRGDDFAQGHHSPGGDLPTVFHKRCSKQERLQRLQATGGIPACEDAVVSALRYLQDSQNKDGSWCGDHQVGMTALALLSYLGHCETASSEEFGETVLNAVTYLINVGLQYNGRLAADFKDKHWPYEHAIATYALAEAYTLCVKIFQESFPGLEDVLQKAGNHIIASQHSSGGWDYNYNVDSARGGDTSLSGWHVQALKACKLTGLPFKKLTRASKAALAYFQEKQLPSGAVGYTHARLHGGQDGTTLAAVAVLSHQIFQKDHSPLVRKGCRFLAKNLRLDWKGADSDLYGHYYAAQAMLNRGGTEWQDYNSILLPQLLAHQNKDGSFQDVSTKAGSKIKAVGSLFKGTSATNIHYRTTLATLTLETYYRYLPASAR